MKRSLITLALAVAITGCSQPEHTQAANDTLTSNVTTENNVNKNPTETKLSVTYQAMLDRFVDVEMAADLTSLTATDTRVLRKIIEVADILDGIYFKQTFENNAQVRQQILASNDANKSEILSLFDLHYGAWDTLDGDKAFFGNLARPDGAGVYPVDLTKNEFNQWIAAHPEDEKSFKSGYTVIVRDKAQLKAIPYSIYYKKELTEAAKIMREAAELTEDQSLKTFLSKRADAFLNDEYRDSEMAWMDLNGSLEIAIGPYETYTDKLFGYKTFFEAFITVRNPEDSAKLDIYKKYLTAMESNLPIPDEHKNVNRGSESPISVVEQVAGGGDNKPGVQTTAFNLPNDEYVREVKGSKKVMLKNVLNAKYQAVMKPISDLIIAESQQSLLMEKYFFNETLFHELSHGLGPGTIIVDGKTTTVSAQLEETYSKIEEGKADVMGAYNMLFLMDKGELPIAERDNMLVTYFAGLFRSMRFGVHEAHGAGAAYQYNYFKQKQAFTFDVTTQTYSVNFDKMVLAITELVHDVCMIQALGDYQQSKVFLDTYAILAPEVAQLNSKMETIPTDIRPNYPKI
ncbi:hypothetical protein CXF83_12550 [Shewanella sp. Choline-02u-19]|uniref:dipeptidyl-peptidase 3 family protein n=1 Tax=unclassified Shewanella TaxID=196818 RepID=UPI000C332516|nr:MULTISPECIES: hypothetical protein [unclassified Shewanella]PKH57973.1 hypothetical protein CXF84_06720 [Shewanella sp. Bg11-22]PKI27478.1 hypothetical protein CXF83_12550 [Shewanella sp. Choline-02u-19]